MKVLVAAQTAGGANALIPAIGKLAGRRQTEVTVLGWAEAASAFTTAGISFTAFDAITDPVQQSYESATHCLESIAPDVLLLGTALGQSLEKLLMRAGKERGIPSVTVVDMWSYYGERFLDPESGELCVPAKVAVMDRLAFDQAVEAGLPESALVITGQPYLEALGQRIRDPGLAADAETLRDGWLPSNVQTQSTRVVLFASEAIAKDFGPETPHYRGYTEVEALEGLLEAVEMAQGSTGLDIKTVVKLHPEESAGSYLRGPLAKSSVWSLVDQHHPWPCILAADVVVGMTTMMLLESAIAGRPTISFQPGASDVPPIVGARTECVQSASTTGELAALLERCLISDGTSARSSAFKVSGDPEFMRAGAAKRVADLVVEVAGANYTQRPCDVI